MSHILPIIEYFVYAVFVLFIFVSIQQSAKIHRASTTEALLLGRKAWYYYQSSPTQGNTFGYYYQSFPTQEFINYNYYQSLQTTDFTSWCHLQGFTAKGAVFGNTRIATAQLYLFKKFLTF